MFKDIEKAIGLVKNPQLGAPNFLLALGLCCFTEYWGRLLTGTAKNEGPKCFNDYMISINKTIKNRKSKGCENHIWY